MDDDDELTIVVAAAPGASALELDGMLHRLEEAVAIAVSDVAVEGYVTNGSTAPGEVRLVIAATHLASSETLSLVGDSVAELLADPELGGWGPYSVNVTDEVSDDDDAAVIWDVLPDSEPEADETPAVDEFDLQAARERLQNDAEHLSRGLRLSWLTALEIDEASLAAHPDAEADPEELTDDSEGVEASDANDQAEDAPQGDDEVIVDQDADADQDADHEVDADQGAEEDAADHDVDAEHDAEAEHDTDHDVDADAEHEEDAGQDDESSVAVIEAKYAAGAVFQASVVVLDHLFMDLQTLAAEHHGATVADVDDAAFFVLHELPGRYAHRYDSLFIQEFIVATVDVTRRFTSGWEPLACVAQELALRMILNGAEFQLELAEVKLSDGWRSAIEDALFEDLDHEMLFDASLDGIEDDSESLAELRSAPLAFADWFRPFNSDRSLPPYLLDEPDPELDADPEAELEPELGSEPE
jgi:hypothetical protein